MDEKLRREMFQEYISYRKSGSIPVEMSFDSFMDMMGDRAMDQLDEDKLRNMRNGGIIGLANGGRIGFKAGTTGTVGDDEQMRKNYYDLKRDEFMALEEYMQSPIAVRDLQNKALGGRIGFQKGRSVQPVEIPGPAQEMQKEMQRLMDERGMSRKDAEEEAEINLFGPSAMKLRDSKNGIASVIASADDDDEYKSPPFIDDPQGMFDTDRLELIMQIMQEGKLSQLEDDDLEFFYDILLEKDQLPDDILDFEDFKRMIALRENAPSRREGIMQMVG